MASMPITVALTNFKSLLSDQGKPLCGREFLRSDEC
jgi:hypothetical protein